jgi:serine/threonine protein kinase
MCVQIWRALDYLDTKRIVHCDMKLDNIFRDSDGTLVVGDFGLAREMDAAGTIDADRGFGNASHRSPEVELAFRNSAMRIPVVKQSAWEAGVIAYEIVCGQHPFGTLYPAARELTAARHVLDVDLLTRSAEGNASLAASIVGLLEWAPAQRTTLAVALQPFGHN